MSLALKALSSEYLKKNRSKAWLRFFRLRAADRLVSAVSRWERRSSAWGWDEAVGCSIVNEKRGCTIYRKLDCEFLKLPSFGARGKLLKFNGTLQPKGCPLTATPLLYLWCRPPSGDHPIAWRFTAQSSGPGGRPITWIHI